MIEIRVSRASLRAIVIKHKVPVRPRLVSSVPVRPFQFLRSSSSVSVRAVSVRPRLGSSVPVRPFHLILSNWSATVRPVPVRSVPVRPRLGLSSSRPRPGRRFKVMYV